jgi:hypothetical protein
VSQVKVTRTSGSSKKHQPVPLWRLVLALALVIFVGSWGLSLMKWGASLPDLHEALLTGRLYAWWAAGALAGLALLLFLFRPASRVQLDGQDRLTPQQAAHLAVATELQLPQELRGLVKVVIRWTRLPHVATTTRWPGWTLRRVARRVIIRVPAGRVTEDPGPRLALKLASVLGQLRRHRWDARKGRCVLVHGTPDPADDVEVPEAATDPQKRAVQIFAPIVGKAVRADVATRDDQGHPTVINVRHGTNFKIDQANALALQSRVNPRMPTPHGDRGWGVRILPQSDTIQLYVRPPIPKLILHPVIDNYDSLFDPAIYGPAPRILPCATGEDGVLAGWNISRKTQKPHALIVGSTGGGKTKTFLALIVGASRRGALAGDIDIWGIDPKQIELMGLEGWPGVTHLAYTVEDMAALIDAAYDEMHHRYSLIRARKIHPDDLPPLLIFLDEFLILNAMLTYWWRVEKKGKGPCPQVNRVVEMLALSRSAGIYICIGIQRPDATQFNDGARDNLRFRASLGELSPQGATMMWNNQAVGTEPLGVVGRGMYTGPNGLPMEAQGWLTPDLDPHPMYRDRLTPEWRERVEQLTPARYVPKSITKDDLWLPPSARPQRDGGIEDMMGAVQEVVLAKLLEVGQLIQVEDDSGRMSRAYVEQVDQDSEEGRVLVDIQWEGGSAEQLDLADDDDVWLIEDVVPSGVSS